MSLSPDSTMAPPPPTVASAAVAPRKSALAIYVGRVREFDRTDWIVYVAWIGMMLGLVLSTAGFLAFGHAHAVRFPVEAWLVPVGAAIFTVAIAIDKAAYAERGAAVLRQLAGRG